MEAWAIVGPILAAHSIPYNISGKRDLDALDEAYIVVYGALKEHDEKVKEERKESNGTAYR